MAHLTQLAFDTFGMQGRLRGETVCAAAEVKAVSAPPSTKKEEFYDVRIRPLTSRELFEF